MGAVYLSRPVKQFSGSRQPLAELALEGFEALLASGGPPPDRLLMTAAHPFELAGISGPELAAVVGRRASELSVATEVEFYANPGLEDETAHLAASAAGAALVHEGARRVAHGEARSLAVLGVEQMRLTDRQRTTEALRSLIHPEERKTGLTMPALGALLTQSLESSFPGMAEALTLLTLANRARTTANTRAHVRKALRVEDVASERNPIVSRPLRLFDVAPTSSGYAGLVLSSEPAPLDVQVVLAGIGRGLDRVSIARRKVLSRSTATRRAMEELLSGLEWSREELRDAVACAEIHDAFPIIEFLGLMDCGLVAEADAVDAVTGGVFDPTGRCPVNTMGGVMGGHPIGATGVSQIVELILQATGRSECRLGASLPRYSFAYNVGGPMTYNCVSLLCAFETAQGAPRDFRLSPRPHAVAADLDVTVGGVPEAETGFVVGSTRLEFPPPGFEAPCHIAIVETDGGARRIVRCLEEPSLEGPVELIRMNGSVVVADRQRRRRTG